MALSADVALINIRPPYRLAASPIRVPLGIPPHLPRPVATFPLSIWPFNPGACMSNRGALPGMSSSRRHRIMPPTVPSRSESLILLFGSKAVGLTTSYGERPRTASHTTVLPGRMRRHETRRDEMDWATQANGPTRMVSGHIDTSERAQVLTDHVCGAVQLHAMPCHARPFDTRLSIPDQPANATANHCQLCQHRRQC